MSSCARFRKKLDRFVDKALPAAEADEMTRHADACPECRRAMSETERILAGADAVHEDLRRAMAGVDWEALPVRIAAAAWSRERGPTARRLRVPTLKTAFAAPWGPVFAAVLAGVIIGSAATLVILKPRIFRPAAGARVFASGDVIARAEAELSRQETLDYLNQSQLLILDLIQNGSSGQRAFRDRLAVAKARELLSKKRYINPQLDSTRMAKAQAICNQIEILFLELSQISDELSDAELHRIKEFVEQKQLLLKINLLRKELDEREV